MRFFYFIERKSFMRIALKKSSFQIALLAAAASIPLLYPVAAHAQLEFTFSQPVQTIAPGNTVSFQAMISNTGSDIITFNGFNPGLTASGLSITDLFFVNVPATLNPGDSGLYQIFDVVADSSVSPGVYNGLADIDYDTTTTTGQHASQVFSLTVPVVVPEASSAVGMLAGMVSMGILVRRRRTK